MHALLIDPISRSISPVDIPQDGGSEALQVYYGLLGCEMIEQWHHPLLPRHHALVIDENGRIRDDSQEKGKFLVHAAGVQVAVDPSGQILANGPCELICGKAFLVALDPEGDWIEPTLDELSLATRIDFL